METSISTFNKIFKKVMGLLDKIKQESPSSKVGDFSLEKQEIEFILMLIKNSSFKGEQVETVYNTVFKLQQQYLEK
jgi:uncharacterized Fe-S cluster-containing protein